MYFGWMWAFNSYKCACHVSFRTQVLLDINNLLTLFLSFFFVLATAEKMTIHAVSTMYSILYRQIYSYFEKGCRKKRTRQSWKVLWVILSALFFKEIIVWEATDLCLRMLKESKIVGLTASVVRNSVLIISHNTFRDCRVHFVLDKLSRNSCIWYMTPY